MSDHGYILVLRDQKQSHREVPGSDLGRYRLSYCVAGNREMDSVGVPENGFDWLVIDGSLIGGDRGSIIQSLRAIDIFFSNILTGSGHGCRVDWTPDGTLQLQCCMQPTHTHQNTHRNSIPELDGIVFEYHAPMKNTGS